MIIYFHQGPSTWSASAQEHILPPDFKSAREWVKAYGVKHNQTITERIKEREKQPKGIDRILFKSGTCHERWLESDVPKLFAEAAIRCQHAGAYCMQDGFCHYGDCDMVMNERPKLDERAD